MVDTLHDSKNGLIKESGKPKDWDTSNWNTFWINIVGTEDYLKVPEITRDFYYNAFIEIREAESKDRLAQIKQDWSSLLDEKSPLAIGVLTDPDLPREQVNVAYRSYIRVVGIIEKPSRYTNLIWLPADIKIEKTAKKRIWAINTKYQFAVDNVNSDWNKWHEGDFSNDARLNGIDMLCNLVGIIETGAMLDRMINDARLRQRVLNSAQSLDRFVSLIYLLREGNRGFMMAGDNIQDIIIDGLKYVEDNLPRGYTYDKLYEKYPLLFDWAKFKLSILDQKVLVSGLNLNSSTVTK